MKNALPKYLQLKHISKLLIPVLLLQLGCTYESDDKSEYTDNVSVETKSKHIKALFFGTGPFATKEDSGCLKYDNSHWVSFPEGSSVEVVIPADTSDEDNLFIIDEINKLNTAIAGYFDIRVTQSNSTQLPLASENQIMVNLVDTTEMFEFCGNNPGGCMKADFQSSNKHFVKAADTYYPAASGIFDMHEVGHGIGLCHVDAQDFAEGTMASAGGDDGVIRSFSELELEAINTVFTSGLEVGASEQDFWDAGLIP